MIVSHTSPEAVTIDTYIIPGLPMHIVSREIYEAALLINHPDTVYQPGLAVHEAALAAGIARRNGQFIELTHKGEEVVRLE